jgi:aspartyl-tRNA(Asn)/glutamyl-tRNA(Gln) amidotransferase subunit C
MSVEITRELLGRVAANARLALTEDEARKLLPQFREILAAFATLEDAPVQSVPPAFQPVPLKNALREDEPTPSLPQDEALANAVHKDGSYFKGPRILE